MGEACANIFFLLLFVFGGGGGGVLLVFGAGCWMRCAGIARWLFP
jgi:hypothetical protein